MKQLILICLVMCIVCTSLSAAATLTILPNADARIEDSDHAATNYGTSFQLKVGKYTSYAMRSYLKFDITQLASLDFSDVDLVLSEVGGSGTTLVEAHKVTDDSWTETGILWSNAPLIDPTVLVSQSIATGTGPVRFNLTSYVRQSLAASDNTLSVALKSNNEVLQENYKIFFARENPSSQPMLEITYASKPPVIGTVTAPTSANEGSSINLTFTVTDAEGDIDTTKILLDGNKISDTTSAVWKVDYESAGQHTVLFYVNDSHRDSDTETRTITINNVQNIVINEFLPQPLVVAKEWIEIYNPLTSDVNVNNCYLTENGDFIVPLTGIIAAKSFGIVSNLAILDNQGDKIRLICGELLVDKVAYGSYNDGNTADNAPLPAPGQSGGRKIDGLDTDVDKNDFTTFAIPTPEAQNQAYNNADTNKDGCVSMQELLTYIGQWKADPMGIGMENLLSAIGLWKAKPVC